MQIEYEGADITKDVSVDTCWHDMYGTGKSDSLIIKFNDTRGLWDSWNPKAGDKIKVTDGAATTGQMYVELARPESSLIVIRALSMPIDASRVRRSKSWEQVRLLQLVSEVCDRYGLTYETYGVEDQTYSYVDQAMLPDFEFLARRCAFEGASFLTYDGKLIVYKGQYMDTQSPQGTIKAEPGMDYKFAADEDARFGTMKVTDGSYTGEYTGEDGKTFTHTIGDRISDQSEADRFAKGLLRFKNKDTRTFTLDTDTFMRQYAAGSVFTVEASAAASWDGPAYIEHMRHDYVRRRSKMWARQVIEDY